MSEPRPEITREAICMKDAARLLDVHYETVRRLCASGQLEAFRVGRVVRIRRDVIQAFVFRQKVDGL